MECGWRQSTQASEAGRARGSSTFLSFVRGIAPAGTDEQHQGNGKDGRAGEDTENAEQRHLPIAQFTEPPIGEPAATDAHEIHDSIPSRPQLRPDDLAE